MPKAKSPSGFTVAPLAPRDTREILRKSEERFGASAALRYQTLIVQAITDIASDPERPGSQRRPAVLIAGARIDHLSFSKTRVSGQRVKDPRHLLVYRNLPNGVIEIARVLRESRDLVRHLPAGYRP